MLALVVADRHEIGLVEQDVAGHQDRVGEQAGTHELLPLALLLELRHPAQLAVARHRRQQPRRLGVRRHVALREHRRALRVEPRREEQRREVERPLAQVGRVVVDRDRVQVDDAEERAPALGDGAFLRRRVLAEAARPVAEVLRARGLDAGEDPHAIELTAAPTLEAVAVFDSTWSPSSWRESEALQQPEWPDDERRRGRPAAPARPAAARLRRRGAPGPVRARRGRRRPGVPAPGGRLRRVVPRLRQAHRDRRRLLRGRDPRAAEDPPADGGRAHLRRRAPGAQGRADRRPVREAALGRRRAHCERRHPRLPRPHDPRRRADRRGADPRPRTDARGLPPRRLDAQPRPRVHQGRLRRPHPGARLEPGLRRRLPAGRALRGARLRDRARARLHGRLRDRPRRDAAAPPGRRLDEPRGPPARLRGGPHQARLDHRRLVRLLRPHALDRRPDARARRRPRRVLLRRPQPARAQGRPHRDARRRRRALRAPESRPHPRPA